MAVSKGSVVRTDSAATMPPSSQGRPPSPCARSVSANTQTVSADWTTNTGQKSPQWPATSSSP